MICPNCGGKLMTFWRFLSLINPKSVLSPVCPDCGARLRPGKRFRRLVWILLLVAGTLGLGLAAADSLGGWGTSFTVYLWIAGSALVGCLSEYLIWRFGDFEVGEMQLEALWKPLVAFFAALGAIVLAAVFLAGPLVGLISGFSERKAPPVYEPDEAAVFAYEHLPDEFRESLTKSDVALILELNFEYLKTLGLVDNPDPSEELVVVDDEEEARFIIKEAQRYGKRYEPEQIYAVLDAEYEYMRHIGIVNE